MSAWNRCNYPRGAFMKLPLHLRQRWWQETNYGRDMPSDALRKEIDAAVLGKEDRDVVRARHRAAKAKGLWPPA